MPAQLARPLQAESDQFLLGGVAVGAASGPAFEGLAGATAPADCACAASLARARVVAKPARPADSRKVRSFIAFLCFACALFFTALNMTLM